MARPTRIARQAVFDWLDMHHRAGVLTAEGAFAELCVAVEGGRIDALASTRSPDRSDLRALFAEYNAPIQWHSNGSEPPPVWRTLADISDDPPQPLLFGVLDPDGPTLGYGPPGVGKGQTCAYLIVEALKAGLRPVIYDPERRPREWARRVSGLGGDRSKVVYLEPPDLGPAVASQPFWEAAPAIKKIIRVAGGDLFICDSILPAVATLGEEALKSDPSVPWRYVGACDSLGVPTLSTGHPPKGQPEGEPFGSFAWVAAFRLTWLVSRAEGSGHVVRLRVRKANERAHVSGLRIRFGYGDDGRPSSAIVSDDTASTREWLLNALSSGPRTVADLAEEQLDEIDDAPAGELERIKERLGQALRRMEKQDGSVHKTAGSSTGRSVHWERAWPVTLLAGER